jgi:hypothetical protein
MRSRWNLHLTTASPGPILSALFGILRAPALEADKEFKQQRVFDFIYPNTATIAEAIPFEVKAGETVSVVLQIPKPVWFNIAGRVTEASLIDRHNVHAMFQRNMGILPDVGGTGFRVKSDGTFEEMLLGGLYVASLHEMTTPDANGYTQSIKRFGSTVVMIEQDALNLEMQAQ